MTKAEVIKHLNENAQWIKEDIADIENSITEKAAKMQGKDVNYIMAAAQYIVRYQQEIEEKLRDLREVETRIKIVNHIEA